MLCNNIIVYVHMVYLPGFILILIVNKVKVQIKRQSIVTFPSSVHLVFHRNTSNTPNSSIVGPFILQLRLIDIKVHRYNIWVEHSRYHEYYKHVIPQLELDFSLLKPIEEPRTYLWIPETRRTTIVAEQIGADGTKSNGICQSEISLNTNLQFFSM